MPHFEARWSAEKNLILRARYGVGFEDVLTAIAEGRILADAPHPNLQRYPGQRVLVVEIRDYAFVVPYITGNLRPFLKTLYPSRKHHRLLRGAEP